MSRYKLVDGVTLAFTPEEESARDMQEVVWTAQAANRVIINQIMDIEASITPSRLREALLGTDNGWLANIELQISALRAQLEQ